MSSLTVVLVIVLGFITFFFVVDDTIIPSHLILPYDNCPLMDVKVVIRKDDIRQFFLAS